MGTPLPPLPAYEKAPGRAPGSVVRWWHGCQNLDGARLAAAGRRVPLRTSSSAFKRAFGRTIVSDESKGGAPKKLSTKDILTAARAQAAKAGGGEAPPPEAESAPEPAQEASAAAPP